MFYSTKTPFPIISLIIQKWQWTNGKKSLFLWYFITWMIAFLGLIGNKSHFIFIMQITWILKECQMVFNLPNPMVGKSYRGLFIKNPYYQFINLYQNEFFSIGKERKWSCPTWNNWSTNQNNGNLRKLLIFGWLDGVELNSWMVSRENERKKSIKSYQREPQLLFYCYAYS